MQYFSNNNSYYVLLNRCSSFTLLNNWGSTKFFEPSNNIDSLNNFVCEKKGPLLMRNVKLGHVSSKT